MSRFLVYLAPAVGHTLPVVPGVLELVRRGHDVRVHADPALVDLLVAEGIDAVPVAPEVVAVPMNDFKADSDRERLFAGQADLVTRGRAEVPDASAAIAAYAPDAVLVDTIAYGAQTAAEVSGLPRATLTPTVLAAPGRGIPPYGPGWAPMPGLLGRVRDALGWKLMAHLFAKAMLPGLNELRSEHGLAPFDSPLEILDAPDMVILMTGEPLEYPRTDLPANVRMVGMAPWDTPTARPAWLDEPGDPWVLVTCSTDYQADEEIARIAVEALRDEPVRVVLTLADAYDASDLSAAGNVRVERFVPHGHVLAEAAVVVCHGGTGIVSKAMAHGVPAVIVPWGRDQPEVARRVAVAQAGVVVPPKRLTPERLRAAVREARALGPSARAAGERLIAGNAAARFADAAEELVGSTDRRPQHA